MQRKITKKRLWYAAHNLLAHPAMEACWWIALVLERSGFTTTANTVEDIGNILHDLTLSDEKKGDL